MVNVLKFGFQIIFFCLFAQASLGSKNKCENLHKKAQSGEKQALEELSQDLIFGGACKQNKKEALSWTEKAAAKGSVWAARSLSQMHDLGDGTKADPQLALKYAIIANRLGDIPDDLTFLEAKLSKGDSEKIADEASVWMKINGLIEAKAPNIPLQRKSATDNLGYEIKESGWPEVFRVIINVGSTDQSLRSRLFRICYIKRAAKDYCQQKQYSFIYCGDEDESNGARCGCHKTSDKLGLGISFGPDDSKLIVSSLNAKANSNLKLGDHVRSLEGHKLNSLEHLVDLVARYEAKKNCVLRSRQKRKSINCARTLDGENDRSE